MPDAPPQRALGATPRPARSWDLSSSDHDVGRRAGHPAPRRRVRAGSCVSAPRAPRGGNGPERRTHARHERSPRKTARRRLPPMPGSSGPSGSCVLVRGPRDRHGSRRLRRCGGRRAARALRAPRPRADRHRAPDRRRQRSGRSRPGDAKSGGYRVRERREPRRRRRVGRTGRSPAAAQIDGDTARRRAETDKTLTLRTRAGATTALAAVGSRRTASRPPPSS